MQMTEIIGQFKRFHININNFYLNRNVYIKGFKYKLYYTRILCNIYFQYKYFSILIDDLYYNFDEVYLII